MINQLDQVFYRAKRKINDSINFLWFPYDGMFEYLFSQFDFVQTMYSNKVDLHHEWRADTWPESLTFIQSMNIIDSPIDICIANNRQTQILKASEIAKSFHMPLILIDHEPATEGSRSGMIEYVNKKMPKNCIFVASHPLVQKSWMYKEDSIIEYGFKLYEDIERKKENEFLIIGDYAESDANFVNIIKDVIPGIKSCGNNINTDRYSTIDELINNMESSKITISAAQSTHPPLIQLLAASQNCLVVTSLNKWTSSIFKHGETAILYESIDDLTNIIKLIEKDKIDIDGIIKNARDMIDKDFNFENSQSKWKKLLTDISNRTFVI